MTAAHLNEMQIAFPGQDVEARDNHVAVPYTKENEALLKRRGYFYERVGTELQVYLPSAAWMA